MTNNPTALSLRVSERRPRPSSDHEVSTRQRVASFGPEISPDDAVRSIEVAGLSRTITVQIATRRSEFQGAFQLLAANYQARGYEAPSTKLFRFTPYHVLPDTITLVAKYQREILATLSLVPDTSLLGLPMESIYGPEIGALRRQGRRLAEATSLADRDLAPREFLQVFVAFIKVVMQYHVRQGGDSWVITVNPRHRNFYLKVLGFTPLGPRRSYPTVQDHPAEAYLLDLKRMRANAPRMFQTIFGETLADAVLQRPRWSPRMATYFGNRSTLVDRRTIRDIRLWVEHFGSPPRWLERESWPDRPWLPGRQDEDLAASSDWN